MMKMPTEGTRTNLLVKSVHHAGGKEHDGRSCALTCSRCMENTWGGVGAAHTYGSG
jgi:hypothetical protein